MIVSIVFYAGINSGFVSSEKSQVNRGMWLYMLDLTNNPQLFEQSIKISEGDSEFSVPEPKLNNTTQEVFNFPVDSVDNSINKKDSIRISDSIRTTIDSTGILGINYNVSDSTWSIDSTLLADSLKGDWRELDSTSRLEQFHYTRKDESVVELKEKKKSKWFVQPSTFNKQRTIKIDSTGRYVEIRETTVGYETKVLLRIPIEDYVEMRLANRERENWEAVGYKYDLKSTKIELGQLIKSLTDFEIPLPKVGVLSIFGEPKISLKIGGSVQIHGAWRNETTEGVTVSRLGNTKNEPDFKQTVQINVNGTIGDKLNISADWNTERTFQYENQLKIKYTGYDDEIIQSIEAGNVSMQTAPLIGGAEALFGIKTQLKLGPFRLTTIASQKKGETKEVSVSGGATSKEFQIRAYDYSENHYFIHSDYADSTLFSNYFFSITPISDPELHVNEIEVWKSVDIITADNSKYKFANAYIDLPPLQPNETKYPDSLRYTRDNPILGKEETGRFQLLTEDVDYILHKETGFISLKTSIQDDNVLAVAFKRGTSDITYGEFIASAEDTLVLLLVKPRNLQPQFSKAWDLKLKNIYPTGSRNIKQEGFEFQIKYEVVGRDPTDEVQSQNGNVIKLLEAFGLDQRGEGSSPTPDNKFDWRPGINILPETGEIIFPFLEPFGSNIPSGLEDKVFNKVYDTTKTFARQDKINDKWLMTGKQTGEASSVYQLGFNVVENSARVILAGRELTEGVDYVVDYTIGQLTIRNDAALVPGADLKISYEQNDLFQLASKTLLGARGIYDFSERTKLGFTIMNLNQQTLSDKVRIGEEPLSNTIMGVDFSTSGELPFLTRLMDNVISTREMSDFSFSGEYAYMDPDPNTKKSTIASDEGKSIAYIDDFEGAKKIIPVGISYTSWKDLSPPDMIPGLEGLSKLQRMAYKSKSFWYNITPSIVTVQDIYGDKKQVARQDQQVTVLDLVYFPDSIGSHNWNPAVGVADSLKWGGTQKLLSTTANNLVEQNIEFLEFWMKIVDGPMNEDASLFLDIGQISEDVIPDGSLNTEDKNGNQAIDEGEDTGLDGFFDSEERINYSQAPDRSDPSGDNFVLVQGQITDPLNYYKINGTEGNAVLTDVGRLPDTEDLNSTGTLNTANSYFRYELKFDTTDANPFRAGGGHTSAGWYLFRIPLKDTLLNYGLASLSNVETIRLFITGVSGPVHIQIADFNLVGSQWQKIDPEDSVLSIEVVSLEENLEYTSPPGVFRERDRTRPDEEIFKNEQSLNLKLTELADGESREAVKYLFRPLDVFNYSEMKLFIHGEMNPASTSISFNDSESGQYSSEVFFRFGTDTNNYYEYRQPVTPGWNSISIKFDELTAIKQQIVNPDSIFRQPVAGFPGHFFQIKGNPSLISVKFLMVGIINLDDGFNTGPLSGEVWVNELRVIGAEDTPGWAYRVSGKVKFADLLTVSANLSETNPYFHRLTERFGSRVESRNWNISTNLDVLKLLPFNMPRSNLKVNFSHSESIGKPLYIPGTDVLVDEAVNQLENSTPDTSGTAVQTADEIRAATQTLRVSNSVSASGIKLVIPTKAWYIRDSFNALTLGFSYSNSFSRNPTVRQSINWVWNANMNYAIKFSPDLYFKPANIPVLGWLVNIFSDYKDAKVYFTPQTFAATFSARRNRNSSTTRVNQGNPTKTSISRDFSATRGFNFGWKITEGGLLNISTSYNVSIKSSLTHLLVDSENNERPEGEIWSDIFGGEGFGKDYQYQQSFDFRLTPKLPSLWDINRYFTITAGYSVNYSWNNDLRQEQLGRSAGYSSKTNVRMVLRWKSLTNPLFAGGTDNKSETKTNRTRVRDRELKLPDDENLITDSTRTESDSTAVLDGKPPVFSRILNLLKITAKTVFFDWENFTFNFTNSNSVSKSGLASTGTGFTNFWGVSFNPDAGPSRAFMLGLSQDPGPRTNLAKSNLNDIFSDKNSFEFRTSRPLWEGAKIDVTWKVGWGMNKSTTLSTDEEGNIFVSNITSTGNINRSFLSLPLPFFDTGIKKVNELYDKNSPDARKSLSDAFIEGFETFGWAQTSSILSEIAKYIPRANWHISWSGLEKLPLFNVFTKRVTLDHAYSSNYSEGWKLTRGGNQEIQTQKIDYGFSPLVGLNITFGQLWGGSLTGNIKYSTRSSYDLGITTSNITETFSKDIGFSASYSKSGFELPLFGVALKNDIEFTVSYSFAQNSIVRFEMNRFREEGIPQDGTIRTTLEPRIRYTISSKVNISIFYKRTSVEPEGAARIPPTTTNEAGLDVNITIQ